jgi:hypothetical protein
MQMGNNTRGNITPRQDYHAGITALHRAIQMHEKHMNGTLPTTGAAGAHSQMQMMMLMKDAYTRITRSVK